MPPDESFTPNSSKPFRGIKVVYEEVKVAQSVEDDEISSALGSGEWLGVDAINRHRWSQPSPLWRSLTFDKIRQEKAKKRERLFKFEY